MKNVLQPRLSADAGPRPRLVKPLTLPAPSDYAVLKRRIKEAGLLDKQPWYYAMSITANISVFVLCLGLLLTLRNPWLQATDAVALGIVFGQLGFQVHDAGHQQMFKKSWKNNLVGFITGTMLMGMSYSWWVDKHNRHHGSPNHLEEDPDVNNLAIAYTEDQALSRRGLFRFLAAYQAFAFFPLTSLLGFSMYVSGFLFLIRNPSRKHYIEIGVLLAHLIAYIGLLVFFLGPWSALLVVLVHKAAAGFYMASVFAPNHKGMPQMEGKQRIDYLRAQVLTARNVKAGAATDIWYGSLNYQIEHHLFPAMPRNRVREAHKIVRDFCAEVGVEYYETSMVQSYREILSFLHEVGRPLRQRRSAQTG